MNTGPREPRRRDPEAPLWKNLRRNVTGMLLFEFLWGIGLPFGPYVSMVPAYLTDLTALGGTLLLPFVATASPLAGRVIDSTGSYTSVFSIGATVSVIALFAFAFLVREPRTGRLYTIKQIAMR